VAPEDRVAESERRGSGWVVGKPEVILGLDLFGGQVVNALFSCVGLSQTDPPPEFYAGEERFKPLGVTIVKVLPAAHADGAGYS
jgi:hypothetical protein